MAKSTFTVEVTPASGKSTTTNVEMEATGATVGQVLKEAGIDPKEMNLSVDGKPANLDTHLAAGGKLSAKVQVTEKARGS